MIKVSIIIPVYNTEKYLEECLQSVVNQTLKEKEIIIVNDGSTDKSSNIIDKYSKLYYNIVVINQNNQGLSSARNSGLKVAKGEYIGFIDSDDLVDIDMYKNLYYYAITKDADIVEGKFKLSKTINAGYSENSICNIYNTREALKRLFDSMNGSVCLGIYKRSLFNTAKFPKGKTYEDLYCKPRLIFNSTCIVELNKGFYFYRKRLDSIINSKFTKKNFDKLFVAQDLLKYFKTHDKNNYRYYRKQTINMLILFSYETLEKAIKDKYFDENGRLPQGLSYKYIISILCLGMILNPSLYIFKFINILEYFSLKKAKSLYNK